MMECSDLSAPKSAKGFVKPSVKDVQVKRGATITYQSSQKSRTWETTDTSESYLKVMPVSTLLNQPEICLSCQLNFENVWRGASEKVSSKGKMTKSLMFYWTYCRFLKCPEKNLRFTGHLSGESHKVFKNPGTSGFR